MSERVTTISSFILTGASGAGKSTVAKALEAKSDGPFRFERAKATVTRQRRGPEDDDYTFVSENEYDRLKKAGKFILETPSYNYRGAISSYVQPSPNVYPMYILTPENARLLKDVLSPPPRIMHIDRMAKSAIHTLVEERKQMSEVDIQTRIGQGVIDRAIAREIEDIGIDNDGPIDDTVDWLYNHMTEELQYGCPGGYLGEDRRYMPITYPVIPTHLVRL